MDRIGNVKPMTVGARLYRVEQQLNVMDRKLDQLIHSINIISTNQNLKMLPSSVSQTQFHQSHHPSPIPMQLGYQQTASAITAQQLQALQLPPAPSQSPSPITCLTHLEDDV